MGEEGAISNNMTKTLATTDTGQTVLTLLLAMLLFLSALRFVGQVAQILTTSLQMDFAAFYIAGAAENAGLSPYRTHLQTDPPLWDGINEFQTSRFLYPPLVATFFQPWAQLDYPTAKLLWTFFGLICLWTSVWLVNRQWRLQQAPIQSIVFALFVTMYFPLLTYIERGQIDALNLLLLTTAIGALITSHRTGQLGAGILIALATLFKLQCIYFVPFLLWRRCWWAIVGYAFGGLLLVALTVSINGSDALINYLRVEMPRISQYGDLGAADQLMDRETWAALHTDLPDGYTQINGHPYQPEAFFFTKNATTVRNLHSILRRFVPDISQTVVSLLALGGFFTLLVGWEWVRGLRDQTWSLRQNFFYWQLVLLIILLAGPMTWIMNLIWLLPLTLALLVETRRPLPRRQALYLALALLAVVLTALPDIYTFPLLLPINPEWLRWHYVFAELLLFGALLLYWGEASYVKRDA